MLLQQLRRATIVLLAVASCVALAAPPAKNKPPTVTLTSPTGGATYTAPATVQLAATAADADGTIAKVEFFRAKTLIGTATTAPYTFTWTPVAAGTYSITAKATDNAGAATSSTAASITVSAVTNTPPTVSLTSPTNGASFGAPATIQLAATAADANGTVAKVEFFRGGTTLIGSATAAPYTFTWSGVAVGSYSITAKATDNAGATATSAAATVNVVTASTLTTITSPTPTTFFSWPVTDVSGTFSGPADTTVLVYNGDNNSTILATLTGPTTFLAKKVQLSQGLNTLTATAIRRDGTSSSASVTVDVPQYLVVLTSPNKFDSFEMPPSLTFQASTLLSSGTVQRVEYYQSGVGKLGSATTPPYSFVWNNPPKGAGTFFARMVADNGAVKDSQQIVFTVVGPNQPPTVSLTAPASGAAFAAPASITLQATAADSDGSVSQVDFLQGGQLLGTTNVMPYSFTAPNLQVGSYSFTARATDDKGASTTSAPVNVTVVSNTAPSVSLVTSAPDAVLPAPATITLTATVADNGSGVGRVEFYNGATLIGTAPTAPYVYTWVDAPAGTHSITARAYNSFGGSADSAPVTVRLSADAAILVDAGIDGSVVAGSTMFVSGTVAAPVNSGVLINGQLAAYDRNGRFSAVVALEPGANTLTFVLSTEAGLTATQAVTVNRTATSTVALNTDRGSAFTGEQVDFELKIAPGTVFSMAAFDLLGNGDYSFTVPASSVRAGSIKFNVPGYPAPSIYRVKARIVDAQGAIIANAETILDITTRAVLDGIARGLWSNINNALGAGAKPSAMTRLTHGAQVKYGPVFDLLMPTMPTIIAAYSDLKTGPIYLDMSEYLVNRTASGSNRSFFIYFVREGDGVWRLESM